MKPLDERLNEKLNPNAKEGAITYELEIYVDERREGKWLVVHSMLIFDLKIAHKISEESMVCWGGGWIFLSKGDQGKFLKALESQSEFDAVITRECECEFECDRYEKNRIPLRHYAKMEGTLSFGCLYSTGDRKVFSEEIACSSVSELSTTVRKFLTEFVERANKMSFDDKSEITVDEILGSSFLFLSEYTLWHGQVASKWLNFEFPLGFTIDV